MVAHSSVEGNAAAAAAAGSNNQRIEHPANNLQAVRHRLPQVGANITEARTRFRPFRNEKEFKIISTTVSMLQRSGFYWGPMTAKQAEFKLKDQPLGTYLIRDSSQKDFFFTLSYKSLSGPINIRINFQESCFSLCGSKESFDSLFTLLEYYVDSSMKTITKPYRKVKMESLQELCRRRIIETCGRDKIDTIPVNPVLKDFLNYFPYRL